MTNAPSSNRYNPIAVLGVFALALIGVGFLVLAVVLLVRGPGGAASPVASPTRLAGAAPQVVFIPTTTHSPPTATLPPTEAATATVPPAASDAPAVSATAARLVKISRPANVRTGPGLTYPPVGGLNPGDTAPAIGRDSSAQWFAISFEGAPKGTGWVSVLVATFDGAINDLPVIEASAPPPQPTNGRGGGGGAVTDTPGAPPPAATNTPNVAGANGIQTISFGMEKTSGAVNESMWFDFKLVNTSGSTICYGVLAAHTDAGVSADSWHAPLEPGKVLDWKDHINFSQSGTYQVYLGICYSGHDACMAAGAQWTHLSNSVAVTIQ